MIKPKITVKKVYSGVADLESALNKLRSYHVKNGILSGTGAHPNSKKGATVAAIAAWNEFGTGRIPPRPFMRRAYHDFQKSREFMIQTIRATVFTKAGDRLRKNPDVKKCFDIFGLKIQSLMIAQIDSGVPPENADSTKERKNAKRYNANSSGSAHTLIDTGIMKKSLAFATEKN